MHRGAVIKIYLVLPPLGFDVTIFYGLAITTMLYWGSTVQTIKSPDPLLNAEGAGHTRPDLSFEYSVHGHSHNELTILRGYFRITDWRQSGLLKHRNKRKGTQRTPQICHRLWHPNPTQLRTSTTPHTITLSYLGANTDSFFTPWTSIKHACSILQCGKGSSIWRLYVYGNIENWLSLWQNR